jgi:hypothetical protein
MPLLDTLIAGNTVAKLVAIHQLGVLLEASRLALAEQPQCAGLKNHSQFTQAAWTRLNQLVPGILFNTLPAAFASASTINPLQLLQGCIVMRNWNSCITTPQHHPTQYAQQLLHTHAQNGQHTKTSVATRSLSRGALTHSALSLVIISKRQPLILPLLEAALNMPDVVQAPARFIQLVDGLQ